MIWTLLTDLAPWLLGIGAALLAAIGYGRAQRKAGEATADLRQEREVREGLERMAQVEPERDVRDTLRRGKL